MKRPKFAVLIHRLKFINLCLIIIFCGKCFAEERKLIILRHGEGEHNHLHIYSTWTKSEGGDDHCLTDNGKLQIEETARTLLEQGINKETVGMVLVSPLIRTRQTAQILVDCGVCAEKDIIIEERIREPLAEGLEGKSTPPLQINEDRWLTVVNASAMRGGESVESVERRVKEVFAEIKNFSKGYVILVTHGFTSQVLLQILGEENIKLGTGEARILSLSP